MLEIPPAVIAQIDQFASQLKEDSGGNAFAVMPADIVEVVADVLQGMAEGWEQMMDGNESFTSYQIIELLKAYSEVWRKVIKELESS